MMSLQNHLMILVVLNIFNSLEVLLLVIVKYGNCSSILDFHDCAVLWSVDHMLFSSVEVLHLFFKPSRLGLLLPNIKLFIDLDRAVNVLKAFSCRVGMSSPYTSVTVIFA